MTHVPLILALSTSTYAHRQLEAELSRLAVRPAPRRRRLRWWRRD